MILTITNTTPDATDLGFLLHKHPDRLHDIKLPFGEAHVFYPCADQDCCKAVLFVEVDPVNLVRGKRANQGGWALEQYVNDRPYTASSLLSTSMSRVFGTALNGRCSKRPELVEKALQLEIEIPVVPAPGGQEQLESLFVPLGYEVEASVFELEARFPDWGQSPHAKLTLRTEKPLYEVLRHLFILIPALDRKKHYWVGKEEIEKLLAKGEGWLGEHPRKEWITRRYLKFRNNLTREALERLVPEEDEDVDSDAEEVQPTEIEEQKVSLHVQRLERVVEIVKQQSPQSVVDLGCGEGKLLWRLLNNTKVPKILGMDVSVRSLEIASSRLKLDRMPERKRARLKLIHGSLTYSDARFQGFDMATLVEVIEHLDPDRLESLERVVFERAKPGTVVVTTPNAEYNVMWESLPAGKFRHGDHRFEWNRVEFQEWVDRICSNFSYEAVVEPLGEEAPDVGAASQLAVFTYQTTNEVDA